MNTLCHPLRVGLIVLAGLVVSLTSASPWAMSSATAAGPCDNPAPIKGQAPTGGPPCLTNLPPTATSQTVTTGQNTPATITLAGADTDNPQLNFSILTMPAHGTLSAVNPIPTGKGLPSGLILLANCTPVGAGSTCTAQVLYTPALGYSGPDSFTFKVNDGLQDSNVATVTINVGSGLVVPQAPVVTASAGTTTFTVGGFPVVIDAGVTVTDPDSPNLSGATAQITTGCQPGDVLGFTTQNGITGVYTAGTCLLTLTGASTVANYQTALRSITFNSTSASVPLGARAVSFRTTDSTSLNSGLSGKTVNAVANPPVVINEVESSGGVPGDWVELFNPGPGTANISGFIFRDNVDNDPTHNYIIPAGSIIPAGGYFLLEEAQFIFGLGTPDSARLFQNNGTTIVDSFSWTPHATSSYGRCPDGTGSFTTTTSVTKGGPNDCSVPVRINEIESSGGVPGDWVELINLSPNPVDISGFVFRDNDDTHNYAIPAATTIPGNGYYVMEEGQFGFGLGSADSARLYLPGGTTLLDSYSWTAHAANTYGRCPNGTGGFADTAAPTKTAANSCGAVAAQPWPGDNTIATIDDINVFGTNMSGLTYQPSGTSAPGTIWAVQNGPGTLWKLIWNGTIYTPDPAFASATTGKPLKYMDGTGNLDAEGVTFGTTVGGDVYVSTERNNDNNSVSLIKIERFDTASAASPLLALNEWNLTPDLPVVGPNLGAEAIAFVPDSYLTSQGFFDESKAHAYNPAEYANHGTGLFFVGIEANGTIYAYALNHTNNTFTRIATISSGFPAVMDLQFDREMNQLWAVCDNMCNGQMAILKVNTLPGPTQGRFIITNLFDRPTGMNNFNNEGFTFAPLAECVSNRRPAFWADDDNDGGVGNQHAIRKGTLTCTPF